MSSSSMLQGEAEWGEVITIGEAVVGVAAGDCTICTWTEGCGGGSGGGGVFRRLGADTATARSGTVTSFPGCGSPGRGLFGRDVDADMSRSISAAS